MFKFQNDDVETFKSKLPANFKEFLGMLEQKVKIIASFIVDTSNYFVLPIANCCWCIDYAILHVF